MVLSEVTLPSGIKMSVHFYKSPSSHVVVTLRKRHELSHLVVPAKDLAEFTRAIQQANAQVVA